MNTERPTYEELCAMDRELDSARVMKIPKEHRLKLVGWDKELSVVVEQVSDETTLVFSNDDLERDRLAITPEDDGRVRELVRP